MKLQGLFYFFSLVFTILVMDFVEQLQIQPYGNLSSTSRSTRKNEMILDSIVLKSLRTQSSKVKQLEKELFDKTKYSYFNQQNEDQLKKTGTNKSNEITTLRILTQVEYCQQYAESSTTCISCQDGYVMNGSKCISCGYECKKCVIKSSLKTECLECNTKQLYQFILYKGKCYYQDYIAAYFRLLLRNQTDYQILKCPSSCIYCQLSNGTMPCLLSFMGFNDVQNYSSIVKPCKNRCMYCSANNINNCTDCQSSFYLKGNSCQRCSSQTPGTCQQCNFQTSFNCLQCQQSYYSSTYSCNQCIDNCAICYGPRDCGNCSDGYFLYKHSVSGASKCVECIEGCKTCVTAEEMVCLSCFKSHFLNANKRCQPCSSNCQQCTSQNNCQICEVGYMMIVISNQTKYCRISVENCQAQYNDNGTCAKCIIGYKVINNKCIFSQDLAKDGNRQFVCNKNQYLKNWQCFNSTNEIPNCIQYNEKGCIKCTNQYYIAYDQNEQLTCLRCEQGCLRCATDSNVCLQCFEGYFVQFEKPPLTCIKCDKVCKTCLDKSHLCTSCYDNYTLTTGLNCVSKFKMNFRMNLLINYFISPNILNQFKFSFKQDIANKTNINSQNFSQLIVQFATMYKALDLSYLNKTNLTGSNSTVIEGYISYPNQQKIHQIYNKIIQSKQSIIKQFQLASFQIFPYTGCPKGQKFNASSGQCQKLIIQNCTTFDSLSNQLYCNICNLGMSFNENLTKCIGNCMYHPGSGCQDCDFEIKTYGQGQSCKACSTGFMMNKDTKKCRSSEIQNCTSYQLSSSNKIICLSCSISQGMNQTKDYKIILNSCSYRINSSQEGIVRYGDYILKCKQGCRKCQSPYKCQECFKGYFLNKEGICLRCINNCLQCNQSQNKCTKCYEGFTFSQQNSSCTQCSENDISCFSCPQFYYPNYGWPKCLPCMEGCKKCNSSTKSCLNCGDGYFQKKIENGSIQCIKCVERCLTCQSGKCTLCYPGFYMKGQSQCNACVKNCWECTSQNQCTRCFYGYRLVNNICVKNIQNCKQYNSNGTCLECYLGFEFGEQDKCVVFNSQNQNYPCDQGYSIKFGSLCIKCSFQHANCLICNENLCQKCQNGFYVSTYENNQTQSVCKKCQMQGCLDCVTNEICSQCKDGYYLRQLSQESINGVCQLCNQNCLKCQKKANYCTECIQNFTLTSSRTCVPSWRFNFTITLPMSQDQFYFQTNKFIKFLDEITGNTNELGFIIEQINSGSTIVEGIVTNNSIETLNKARDSMIDSLTSDSKFLNKTIIDVSLSEVWRQPKIETHDPAQSIETSDIGIIIGIVVGSVVVGLIIGAAIIYYCFIKKRKQSQQPIKTDSSSESSRPDNPQGQPEFSQNNNQPRQPDDKIRGSDPYKIDSLQPKKNDSKQVKINQKMPESSHWVNPSYYI